jgi:bile acid-coenzyme A ligase
VALSVPNSVELIAAALATWKIGAVPIPMRWDLPDWEQQRLLEVIAPAFVLSEDNVTDLTTLAASQDDSALPDIVSRQSTASAARAPPACRRSSSIPRRAVDPGEGAAVHGAMDAPGDRCASGHPGASTDVPHQRFRDAELPAGRRPADRPGEVRCRQVLDAIERHRVTNFTATPTMLARIADVPGVESRDLSSVVWILQGGRHAPDAVALLVRTAQSAAGGDGLRMTENLGLAALRGDEWLAHPGSVGRGFRDTEVRIADDHGKPLGTGVFGEIYLRAPMTGGYRYIGGAALLPTTADGFTSAGDLGHLDAEGYLYIADRRTDMIVSGGANVFPAEVESALIDHPGIADVVVIGLTDEQWGRRVHAGRAADLSRPPSAPDVIAFAKSDWPGTRYPRRSSSSTRFAQRPRRSIARPWRPSGRANRCRASIGVELLVAVVHSSDFIHYCSISDSRRG